MILMFWFTIHTLKHHQLLWQNSHRIHRNRNINNNKEKRPNNRRQELCNFWSLDFVVLAVNCINRNLLYECWTFFEMACQIDNYYAFDWEKKSGRKFVEEVWRSSDNTWFLGKLWHEIKGTHTIIDYIRWHYSATFYSHRLKITSEF